MPKGSDAGKSQDCVEEGGTDAAVPPYPASGRTLLRQLPPRPGCCTASQQQQPPRFAGGRALLRQQTFVVGLVAVIALVSVAGLAVCVATTRAVRPSRSTSRAGFDWEPEDAETLKRFERELLSEGDDDDSEHGEAARHFDAPAAMGGVSCGGHTASTCRGCARVYGKSGCNGDCAWEHGQCTRKNAIEFGSDNPFGCPKDGGRCRARSGSTHLIFKRPRAARQPSWHYNEVVATHASSSTFYAASTHGYGFAGMHAAAKGAAHGHAVVCGTWGQGAGAAKIEACGEGVSCMGPSGGGTGARATWKFKWTVGNRYAWMLLRQRLPDGRIEHVCWFHAEELKDMFPGGWKHIATATSGENGFGATFRDSGSFLEQWTHMDTNDLRRSLNGPAYYRDAGGPWGQAVAAKFSPYCGRARMERMSVRCDYTSAGLADGARLYMATGGQDRHVENSAKVAHLDYPAHACGLPAPLNQFDRHKPALLSAARVEDPDRGAIGAPHRVSCGNHTAASCDACPADGEQYHGTLWCHGDCAWKLGQCMDQQSALQCPVSCGGHTARSCEECGAAEPWCNGDCAWAQGKCSPIAGQIVL